jgi:alcohol dehydrogenase class IV
VGDHEGRPDGGRFEFATAGRIVVGPGTIAELPGITRALGTRALVVTGRDTRRAAPAIASLNQAGLACATWATPGEPTVTLVGDGAAAARAHAATVVVAIGGGSAIDAGKAIAALAANDGDVLDYLEVVGRGQPLTAVPLPFIAVPTTAGTGAEVTRNAVVSVPQHGVKASLRSPLMLPRAAVVDPDLAIDLPPAITAATGLDALTQLIEPYVSSRANPLVDALCLDGMRRVAGALRAVCRDGHDSGARESMAVASLFSGLALANAGLGVVHGFAAAIGGRFQAPHGAICAALLPHACAANLRAIDARAPGHPARERYVTVARALTGRGEATAEAGLVWLQDLVNDLRIPPIGTYGVGAADVDGIVTLAMRTSSMKGNPIALTTGELATLLTAAM